MRSLLRRVRGRLSFANVTALLALFVALGGTSYAASVGRNSVGAHQIRKQAVGRSEIRPDAVGKSEIRRDAVGASEIRRGAVGKSEIRSDAVGQGEIRNNAVGTSELRKDSVGTDIIKPSSVGTSELQDGGVNLVDIAPAARAALTTSSLQRAAVTKAGAAAGGNATGVARTSTGAYTVTFGRDVSACQYSATLAGVKHGDATDLPDPGRLLVLPGAANTQVQVRTYADDATTHVPTLADEPFHLMVAC